MEGGGEGGRQSESLGRRTRAKESQELGKAKKGELFFRGGFRRNPNLVYIFGYQKLWRVPFLYPH